MKTQALPLRNESRIHEADQTRPDKTAHGGKWFRKKL